MNVIQIKGKRMINIKNKDIQLKIINIIIKRLILLGMFLICIGIGATYQASHDVSIMNATLSEYADTRGILTDGVSYYSIYKYSPDTNYSFLNYTLCEGNR